MMEYPEKTLSVLHLDEPDLEFAYGQVTPHPKDGLHLYGPHKRSKKSREVRIGVIGTIKGVEHFKKWARELKSRIDVPEPTKRDKADRLHLTPFPGIEEALNITFSDASIVAYTIPDDHIDKATRIQNHYEAVSKTVALYLDRVARHRANDEREVDVWALVVPELVFERCRPNAKRVGLTLDKGMFGKRQKERSDIPLFAGMGNASDESIFDDAPDFHRQVKAAFLNIAPTQLLRETTLAPEAFLNAAGKPLRQTQDRATVAWNLATGLYYKTQPFPPWRLAHIRDGVCYIGLVYKNLPNDQNDHVCCAAQMFLSEGDGVVFRGANGPWKTNDYEYHLKPDAAQDLIRKVLGTYSEQHGPPKELFIHGRTKLNDEEWRAITSAAPAETNIVAVRIQTTDGEMKLFRDGDYPVLRGTALILDDDNAYLWTTGYVPQLDTYIGPETPNPLFVTVLRSRYEKPKLATVLRDILGLTKINYNSCNFNDGQPVTVRFANMVGDILVMGSAKAVERQTFKFYV
jgi:hypothetical protein